MSTDELLVSDDTASIPATPEAAMGATRAESAEPVSETAVSADLTARAARIARNVADVLDRHGSADSGAAEAAGFLRGWADAVGRFPQLTDAPVNALAERFSLVPVEVDLLLLTGLPEEHEGIAATFRSLNPAGEPHPTAGLASLVLNSNLLLDGEVDADGRAALRALLNSGQAVRHGLLRLSSSGTFFERSLLLADSLWEALHGHDVWPAGLPRVSTWVVPPGLSGWLAGASARRAVAAMDAGTDCTIVVAGSSENILVSRAVAVAAAAGRPVTGAQVKAGDTAGIALAAAHAALRGAVPLLVLAPAEQPEQDLLDVGGLPGPVLICSSTTSLRTSGNRPMLSLDAGPVGVQDQRDAWAAAVPNLSGQSAGLAARHPLDPRLIADLAADVQALGGEPEMPEVSSLIRARAGLTLPPGVELLSHSVPWNHLVMPEEGAWQLRDAVARLDCQSVVLDDWQLRDRAHAARGTRLLFTGPPGTGKSLAAHAIATAAGTDLLLVDVSRLVSKWLGETEKNLAAAFDTAERTQALLLLDEADALFGARTEISAANDRYANLETAYLLQRLDRFDGLVILTTNLRANIDAAFIRRMDFVVEFPMPDACGRTKLWTRHLPPDALAEDVDLPALARLYPVPGGWIRNAAITAAYVAAAAGDLISQANLVAAMQREYAKAALRFPGEPPRKRND
jgi:hypothetical protein